MGAEDSNSHSGIMRYLGFGVLFAIIKARWDSAARFLFFLYGPFESQGAPLSVEGLVTLHQLMSLFVYGAIFTQ